MRRFLLILFVLVLPLRAVAGDLMALAMATLPHGTPAAEAAAMAPDCETHHAAAAADHHGEEDEGQTHDECCALCLPMTQTGALSLQRVDIAHRVAAASESSFLSAAPSRSLRPPSS